MRTYTHPLHRIGFNKCTRNVPAVYDSRYKCIWVSVSLKTDLRKIIDANARCLNTWLCRHSVGISGILLNYGQLLTLSALLSWVSYCYMPLCCCCCFCFMVLLFAACHCLVAYFVASDAAPPSGWCTVIFVCWWWWLRCLYVYKSVCMYVWLFYALTNVLPWRWREIPVWNKSIFVLWRLLFADIYRCITIVVRYLLCFVVAFVVTCVRKCTRCALGHGVAR